MYFFQVSHSLKGRHPDQLVPLLPPVQNFARHFPFLGRFGIGISQGMLVFSVDLPPGNFFCFVVSEIPFNGTPLPQVLDRDTPIPIFLF